MKSIIALFLMLPSFAQAFCETYSRFGGPEVICFDKEVKALVSEKCFKGCEAVKFLKENNKRPTEIDRVGGKNPATQYCKAYDLKVHILVAATISKRNNVVDLVALLDASIAMA